MSKKPTPQPQDKYVLRMPDGLRDRIKAYAERQGTTMNYEIVRVLEREWPEQWPIDTRLTDLADMMVILKAGLADPRIDDFIRKFEETVKGIVSGRVTGVDLETRESVMRMWAEYQAKEDEIAFEASQDAMQDYDEEEHRSLDLIGTSEKYATPPPRRKDWREMTEEEQDRQIQEDVKSGKLRQLKAVDDDPFGE